MKGMLSGGGTSCDGVGDAGLLALGLLLPNGVDAASATLNETHESGEGVLNLDSREGLSAVLPCWLMKGIKLERVDEPPAMLCERDTTGDAPVLLVPLCL